MKMTRLISLAVCVALAPCLGGCFALDPPIGGAAIKREGNALLVAVCVSVADAVGKVTYRDLAVKNEWIDAWIFDFGGDLEAGTVLSTDPKTTPPFAGEERGTISMDPGVDILVEIQPGESGSDGVFADLIIPDSGLSEGAWLQQDGSTTERPCQ